MSLCRPMSSLQSPKCTNVSIYQHHVLWLNCKAVGHQVHVGPAQQSHRMHAHSCPPSLPDKKNRKKKSLTTPLNHVIRVSVFFRFHKFTHAFFPSSPKPNGELWTIYRWWKITGSFVSVVDLTPTLPWGNLPSWTDNMLKKEKQND